MVRLDPGAATEMIMALSALLHNGSTIVTGLRSMTNLLEDKEKNVDG